MRKRLGVVLLVVVATAAMLVNFQQEMAKQGSSHDYVATHQHGIATIPWAAEMDSHFGRSQVDHLITHFGSNRNPLTWNSEVHFGGRFSLTLQVPVDVNYATNKVVVAGPPRFYLTAMLTVDEPPGGQISGRYNPHLDRKFDEQLWRRFVDSGFDLSILSISTSEQFQIRGFDSLVAAIRRDRIAIPPPPVVPN